MGKKIRVLDPLRGYNAAATVYDQKEKYLNSFEKGAVLPLLGDINGKEILDVGAGTGRLSVPLQRAGAHVTAVDVSSEMLKVLSRKNNRIVTVVGEAEALPFADNSFDIVVAVFLIVHLKNPQLFFDEAYRVLKDGGIVLVTNINQKDPPPIATPGGEVIVESYYHRPEAVREALTKLAFGITTEKLITENDVWVNQIIVAQK